MKKQMSVEEQKEAIDKAKARMMISSPFFGFIALQYPTVFDERIETACTDGRTIRFNPKMANIFSVSELEFVWAHEACHVALMHPLRMKGLIHNIANAAADYVVNLILADSGYNLPQGSLLDSRFKGMDVKAVYDILIQENHSIPENPGIGEITEPENTGESDLKGIEQRIKEVISQAETQARICGKLLGALKEIIERLLYPKRNPEELLQEFMQSCLIDDYTWNRKNRRYDFYMPARDVENTLQCAVIVVDTSGSMGSEELAKCAGFIDAARRQVSIEKTILLYCDTELHYGGEYGTDDVMSFEAVGRGGTRFDPPFMWVDENMPEPPDCLIYLTDLCGSVTVSPPDYPVLWLRYGDWTSSVPFGQVIDMD